MSYLDLVTTEQLEAALIGGLYPAEVNKDIKAELYKRSLENDTKLLYVPQVSQAWVDHHAEHLRILKEFADVKITIPVWNYTDDNECKCNSRDLFNFGHDKTCPHGGTK